MIGVGVAYIVALLHFVSSPMCLNDTWSVVDIRSYWVPSFWCQWAMDGNHGIMERPNSISSI